MPWCHTSFVCRTGVRGPSRNYLSSELEYQAFVPVCLELPVGLNQGGIAGLMRLGFSYHPGCGSYAGHPNCFQSNYATIRNTQASFSRQECRPGTHHDHALVRADLCRDCPYHTTYGFRVCSWKVTAGRYRPSLLPRSKAPRRIVYRKHVLFTFR